MSETNEPSPASVASHTLALLRRLDARLEQTNELLSRQQIRLERIERDVREIRSDIVTMENSILNRMNEILDVSRRLDDHVEAIKSPVTGPAVP